MAVLAPTAPARTGSSAEARALPGIAYAPVLAAMAALATALTATSDRYGYHRDELYFRMLRPAWGYVDQPPLTPLLARAFAALSDHAWALRIPATLATVASVFVLVLVTRELGGGRRAQTLGAWGYGFAAIPLVMGHALLTSTIDLPVWPALLLVALACGVLAAGPRRLLWSRWVLGGAGVALVLAAPNLAVRALDDGVGVDNEEQGEPIGVCRGPVGGWRTAWPALKHEG